MATKTYPQLTEETTVQDADLLASYRATGPLKRLTALVLKTYAQVGALLVDGSVPMTGGLAAYYGTEGSPGVTFNGDNDTGLFRQGANSLGVVAGGVERMRVASAGVTLTANTPLTLGMGTTTNAPLNFTAGANLSSPVAGALEFDGSLLYLTIAGPTRKTLAFTDSSITGSAAKWTTARALSFTGDVTGSGSVDGSADVATALTIGAGTVTNAKLANVSTATLKGRTTAGTGVPEDLTATQAKTLLGIGTAAAAATGTSGHTLPYLDDSNTWSASQTINYAYAGGAAGMLIMIGSGTEASITMEATSGGSEKFKVGVTSNGGGFFIYNQTAAALAIGVSSANAIRFPAYGAGSTSFLSDGTLSSSSSEVLKDIVGNFADNLPDLPGDETRAIKAFRVVGRAKLWKMKAEQQRLAAVVATLPELTAAKTAACQAALALADAPDRAEAAELKVQCDQYTVALDNPNLSEVARAELTDQIAVIADQLDRACQRQGAEDAEDQLTALLADHTHLAGLADDPAKTTYIGWTAEAVQQGVPAAVKASPDGTLGLDNRGLQALQTEVIFDLLDQLAVLTDRVAMLEAA